MARSSVLLAVGLSVSALATSAADARVRCTGEAARAVTEALADTLTTECPCDGGWRNHGEYVHCVARTAASLYRASNVPRACARRSVGCAARSTCGHPAEAVRCCLEFERACIEAPPSTASPAYGRCQDSGRLCDHDRDCVILRCGIVETAEACAESGGVANGPGSCCDGTCPAGR